MSNTRKFEEFHKNKLNENLDEAPNGIIVYADGKEIEENIGSIDDVKSWAIENQRNFDEIMIMDESGDSIVITREDTLEDIELLFSDMNSVESEEECESCPSDNISIIESEEEADEYFSKDTEHKFGNELGNEEHYKEYEEDYVSEYEEKVNRKFNAIKKRVDTINGLITKAIDTDGDALEVIDASSTWEEPMVYDPIKFENNVLTISYKEPWGHKRGEVKTEEYDLNKYLEDEEENYWIFEEAKDMLAYVSRMYKKAIKKATREGNLATEETSDNGYSRDMVSNELGIDASEFDDSSDLGMMADRIGESKTTLKFGDFIKKK